MCRWPLITSVQCMYFQALSVETNTDAYIENKKSIQPVLFNY